MNSPENPGDVPEPPRNVLCFYETRAREIDGEIRRQVETWCRPEVAVLDGKPPGTFDPRCASCPMCRDRFTGGDAFPRRILRELERAGASPEYMKAVRAALDTLEVDTGG